LANQYRKIKLPIFLHSKPLKFYQNEWLGWGDYLNSNNVLHSHILDYQEFKKRKQNSTLHSKKA